MWEEWEEFKKRKNLMWLDSETVFDLEFKSLIERLVEARIKYGYKEFNKTLTHRDTFGINAELASKIKKLGFSIGGEFSKNIEEKMEIKVKF